jgi:hypothetical protein
MILLLSRLEFRLHTLNSGYSRVLPTFCAEVSGGENVN